MSCAELNWSICRLGCGLRLAEGAMSSVVFSSWHQCPMCTISIILRQCTWQHSAVSCAKKRLNRSIWRLGYGFEWTEGSTKLIIFARWRQCAHVWVHICANWRIRLNRTSAAVMRSYVKLLWPLVKFWVRRHAFWMVKLDISNLVYI